MNDTPRILFESQLIDEGLRKDLEAALATGQIAQSREIILFLSHHATGSGNRADRLFPRFGSDAERTHARNQVTSQIDVLARAHLVTAAVAARLREMVDSAPIDSSLRLPLEAATLTDFEEFMSPPRVRPFADQLFANGVLDAEAHRRLLDDLNHEKLSSNFDLIRYCKHARAFELASYPSDLANFLPQIYADVAALLPGLAFTDFHYQIDDNPHVEDRLRVSL